MQKIAIIDYEMSNLNSIHNALKYIGFKTTVTNDPKEILTSDGAVLPGVGAFQEAMKNITRLNLKNIIEEFIYNQKLFLGICLGMQLLFEKSEEFSNQSGLSLIEGEVKGFSNYKIKRIPHVGWNKISVNYEKKQLNKNHEKYYYFVHSFFFKTKIQRECYCYNFLQGLLNSVL